MFTNYTFIRKHKSGKITIIYVSQERYDVNMKNSGAYLSEKTKKSVIRKVAAASLCAMLMIGSVLTFASCGNSDDAWQPAGMKLASSEDADYKLWIPESWTVDMSTGITSAYVSSTDLSNISLVAMNLSGDDNYLTPGEYWESYKADLASTFSDIAYDEDTANGISLLLDGNAAMKYSYTATVTGTAFHFQSVICIKNGTVYLLTYTAQPGAYERNLDSVQSIIDNFRFSE